MTICEICDMERDRCAHAFKDREAARLSQGANGLVISPSGHAHFKGCPHPGPDPDLSHWGAIDGQPDAWQRLGNGESVKATGGARPERTAKKRCRHCVDHGPW